MKPMEADITPPNFELQVESHQNLHKERGGGTSTPLSNTSFGNPRNPKQIIVDTSMASERDDNTP